MKQVRVFVMGPMTGLPEYNYPAFHAEAARLRAKGFHVENPAENPEPPCKSWAGYVRMSVRQLMTCDLVSALPGWEKSDGAAVEHFNAQKVGIQVFPAGQL